MNQKTIDIISMLTASEKVLVAEDEAIVEDYKSQYTTLNRSFKDTRKGLLKESNSSLTDY